MEFHRAVLGPVLFTVYISDIDVRLNSFMSNFADNKKIRKSIINDLDKLPSRKTGNKSRLVQKVEMHFNVNKCHILKVGAKNKKFDYEMNSTQWVKDLGVAIPFNLKFSQQCKDAVGKTTKCWVL